MQNRIIHLIIFFLLSIAGRAFEYDAIVAKDGTGTVKTIAEAIELIPANYTQRFVILVKEGTYNEKIKVEVDYVSIIGEDSSKCIIEYNQLKSEWTQNKDYQGPAVVNVNANDFIIKNITVRNIQSKVGKNANVLNLNGTRTVIDQCRFVTVGSNSISLFGGGNYYALNSHFEGAVDLFRLQGNGWIENCTFFQHEAIGTVWHAAVKSETEKLVLKNCTFDGVQHFFLGRHHYDAQYFFIGCQFSDRMADKPIYHKTYKNQEKDRPYFWGERYNFYNCTKKNTQYDWFKSSLSEKEVDRLTIESVFEYQWNPVEVEKLKILALTKVNGKLQMTLNREATISSDLVLIDNLGQQFKFNKGRGRLLVEFIPVSDFKKIGMSFKVVEGRIIASEARIETFAIQKLNRK